MTVVFDTDVLRPMILQARRSTHLFARLRRGRGTIHALVLALLLTVSPRLLSAQDQRPATRDTRREMTPATRVAVQQGLQWLAGRQQEDGSFGGISRYRYNPGVVGLCGMALLASGSTPGRGPYGEHVNRATDYILSCARSNGYIIEDGVEYYHGPMYGHGFAATYLAEVYGMDPRADLRQALRRAVQLIVDSQNDQGGWRYTPGAEDADISVTVCQVMALRAARNAGISVPKETIDRSVDYVERSQNPADGGFRYQLLERAESRFPRSAAALVALYTSGVHEGPVLERGLEYMMQFVPGRPGARSFDYYHYAHYYAVQAAWHAGGSYWEAWYPAIRDELLGLQLADGSWSDLYLGNEYATAMALIVLQVPNSYLPIFER